MDRQDLREAYESLVMQMEPSVMITLATNQAWTIEKMTGLVGEFFGRLDRKGLGHTFSSAPYSARANGIAFIEKPDLNAHAHALVTIPYGNGWGTELIVKMIWEKLCPSGSVDVTPITSIAGAAHYCTKEVIKPNFNVDQVVPLRGFMPQKSFEARTN